MRPVSWHTLFIAALTIGLLWLFFRNVDPAEIWRAIAGARPGLIVAAILVTLQTYLLRAWRWQVLLQPLGHSRFRTAFRTTVIGFTATFLLPGRIGEVLRPYLLARQDGLSAPATFATIVIERLFDIAAVVVLFGASLPFLTIDVGRDVKVAGGLAAAATLGALIVLFLSAGHPERIGRWAGILASRLPARMAASAARLAQTFVEGLAVMRSPGQLAIAAAWSIPLWMSLALGIWFTSLAFNLTFAFAGTFLVVMFLVVGVAVPTPGGVGSFHAAYRYAVTWFFHADPNAASAAALVLHAVSFVPVTILGLAFMWQDGLTLGGLKGLRAEARAAETR